MTSARSLLVAPAASGSLLTGGGQRTAILCRALRQFGEVDVVLLGEMPHRVHQRHPFGEGVNVIQLPARGFEKISRNAPLRQLRRARKLISPGVHMTADRDVARALQQLDSAPYDLAVFRFFQTFGVGWAPGLAHRTIVDLDDRDDQKYGANIRGAIGDNTLGRAIHDHVTTRLYQLIDSRLHNADWTWVVEEKDTLPQHNATSSVVPNAPWHSADDAGPVGEAPRLLFVGSAGHEPNIFGLTWFLNEVWPLIVSRRPDAEIDIVGSGNWDSVRLPMGKGVTLIGYVDDITSAYGPARAVISPISVGGGSKIKVIEAAAHARPVVLTSHSARGFDAPFGDLFDIADTPEDFATSCLAHLDDRQSASAKGAQLYQAQNATYSRDAIEAAFAADIRRFLSSRRSSQGNVA